MKYNIYLKGNEMQLEDIYCEGDYCKKNRNFADGVCLKKGQGEKCFLCKTCIKAKGCGKNIFFVTLVLIFYLQIFWIFP